MDRYKIIVAYDGTAYSGWQQQSESVAVSNRLEKTFAQVFGQSINLLAASRTDAGVHALGQVALFSTDLTIDKQSLLKAWNNRLPSDIYIRSIEHVNDSFHPHYAVDEKIYWYHVFSSRPLPFAARYGYHMRYQYCTEKLFNALQVFVGTHDFRSFCTGTDYHSTVRSIDQINVTYLHRWNAHRIEVRGPKFLRYMIRRIVGAALEIASRPELSIDYLNNIFIANDPNHTLPCAPAHGLMLAKIKYRSQE
ncbi:MAG: tRNA pseudouridine synthase A [Candidatus Dependentiae bacterium ADurb.Bin331]|nr:MAG: tRNA pseudouridine synthase A [Candidatus Dependentiae bacterium ADurb.Bin331]